MVIITRWSHKPVNVRRGSTVVETLCPKEPFLNLVNLKRGNKASPPLHAMFKCYLQEKTNPPTLNGGEGEGVDFVVDYRARQQPRVQQNNGTMTMMMMMMMTMAMTMTMTMTTMMIMMMMVLMMLN